MSVWACFARGLSLIYALSKQVAAHAEHHLCVRKDAAPDGRMLTAVVPLHSEADRAAEVAAMLGLDLAAARAMLRDAAEGEDAVEGEEPAGGSGAREGASEGRDAGSERVAGVA